MLDSHCHLDFPEFDADRSALVADARARGIEGFLVPGVHEGLWAAQEALVGPGIHLAVGLHPWWLPANQGVDAMLSRVADRARRLGAVAIGECGLDAHRQDVTLDAQLPWFEGQLELARVLELPLVLHQVGARAEFLSALGRAGSLPRGGVVHGFGGDGSWARALVARGFRLGFGPRVLAPRRERLREAFSTCPLSCILLETDAPASGPSGRRNVPADLADLCVELAALRRMSPGELARTSDDNLAELLGKSSAAELVAPRPS